MGPFPTRLSLVYEVGQVESVGMRMVGVGGSAGWREYVLVVGKAKKKKVFILLRNRWFDIGKFELKRNKVSDKLISFIHSGQAISTQLKSHWAGVGSVEGSQFSYKYFSLKISKYSLKNRYREGLFTCNFKYTSSTGARRIEKKLILHVSLVSKETI